MQTGSFWLAGSAFRTGTPVLVQERCRRPAAGQQLLSPLTPKLGRLEDAPRLFVGSFIPSERSASRRGSGKLLVSGGSDLKEGEDTEEALKPSAEGEFPGSSEIRDVEGLQAEARVQTCGKIARRGD